MSRDLMIIPEKEEQPLTMGQIQKEMVKTHSRYGQHFESVGLHADFKPALLTPGFEAVEIDPDRPLSLGDYFVWITKCAWENAALLSLSNFFPLWDELETHRQKCGLSFYYVIEGYGGGLRPNDALWRLTAVAIANLIGGLVDLSGVFFRLPAETVQSFELENILLKGGAG